MDNTKIDNQAAVADEKTVSKPKRKYTRRTTAAKAKTPAKASAKTAKPKYEKIFSLDIGTRSVIGIVAEKTPAGLKIIATERMEHKTRAMEDGQIHDVPQVASVIDVVKKALIKKVGPLKSAAVAAAGRALYTMTASADMEFSGIITAEQERNLDFAGVQAAQAQLATSGTVEDLSNYYCVGYSTIKYELDGTKLKTLVGQRGRVASATVIATFLPRQVIDSMHSALQSVNLEMHALTLEPIAAINVLIPPTMRHLNLVLVDIGAGTSDVAITRNGSVIAYGMVPQAGDEITDAISQQYLLDFNVAEKLKRDATNGLQCQFADIMGMGYDLPADEVLKPILPNIRNLAEAIALQILELNGHEAPQAIILVGGGSLTPHLSEYVSDIINLPISRVAVRHPEKIDGILEIPKELQLPDAVTPLGILKIASLNTLHFLRVYVNDTEYSLFNFRDLTVSDALLNAGIILKKLNGRPGLGAMLKINGENKFIPGSMGTMAQLLLDGAPATLDTPIKDDSHLQVIAGKNGSLPEITLEDVVDIPPSYTVFINGQETNIAAQYTINGQQAQPGQLLHDGDEIVSHDTRTLGEVLHTAGFPPLGKKIKYTVNDRDAQYTISPQILLNDNEASLSDEVHQQDSIEYIAPDLPKLGDVLNVSELDASLVIYYEGHEHKIPSATVSLEVNGHPASTNTLIEDGSQVRFMKSLRAATTVSDALLAVGFQPPAAQSRVSFTILVNKQPVNFTDPIKNGDELEVVISKPDDTAKTGTAKAAATGSTLDGLLASIQKKSESDASIDAPRRSFLDSLGSSGNAASPVGTASSIHASQKAMTPTAIQDSIKLADKINSIPGLSEALRNNH